MILPLESRQILDFLEPAAPELLGSNSITIAKKKTVCVYYLFIYLLFWVCRVAIVIPLQVSDSKVIFLRSNL